MESPNSLNKKDASHWERMYKTLYPGFKIFHNYHLIIRFNYYAGHAELLVNTVSLCNAFIYITVYVHTLAKRTHDTHSHMNAHSCFSNSTNLLLIYKTGRAFHVIM